MFWSCCGLLQGAQSGCAAISWQQKSGPLRSPAILFGFYGFFEGPDAVAVVFGFALKVVDLVVAVLPAVHPLYKDLELVAQCHLKENDAIAYRADFSHKPIVLFFQGCQPLFYFGYLDFERRNPFGNFLTGNLANRLQILSCQRHYNTSFVSNTNHPTENFHQQVV